MIYNNAHFLALAEPYGLLTRAVARKFAVGNLPTAMRRLLNGVQEHGRNGVRPLREAAFVQSGD